MARGRGLGPDITFSRCFVQGRSETDMKPPFWLHVVQVLQPLAMGAALLVAPDRGADAVWAVSGGFFIVVLPFLVIWLAHEIRMARRPAGMARTRLQSSVLSDGGAEITSLWRRLLLVGLPAGLSFGLLLSQMITAHPFWTFTAPEIRAALSGGLTFGLILTLWKWWDEHRRGSRKQA